MKVFRTFFYVSASVKLSYGPKIGRSLNVRGRLAERETSGFEGNTMIDGPKGTGSDGLKANFNGILNCNSSHLNLM